MTPVPGHFHPLWQFSIRDGALCPFLETGKVPPRRGEKARLEKPDWDSSTITLTCMFLSQWEQEFLKKKPGPVPGTREVRLGPKGGAAA